MFRLAVTLALAFFLSCSTLVHAIPASEAGNFTIFPRITHTGRATFFYVGLGNCGKWNKDSDHIVALSTAWYKTNGDGHYCDRWLSITNKKNGRHVYAKVRDSCPPCGHDDLDLSPSAFDAIGDRNTGQYQVSWNFMPAGWKP